jgi:hypothetical protein
VNIKFPKPLLSREAYQIREWGKEDENLQMWRLFSICVFSSYVLEKFTICDEVWNSRGTQNFFFPSQQSNKHFLYWPWKNGIVSTKVCVQNWPKFKQNSPQVVVAIFLQPSFLPSFLVYSMNIITPTCTRYLLLRKQSQEDKNILWMMRMIFERHPCCGTTSMSTNAMQCSLVCTCLVCVPRCACLNRLWQIWVSLWFCTDLF